MGINKVVCLSVMSVFACPVKQAKRKVPKWLEEELAVGCWLIVYDFSFGIYYCFKFIYFNRVETDPNTTKVIIFTRAFYNLVKLFF